MLYPPSRHKYSKPVQEWEKKNNGYVAVTKSVQIKGNAVIVTITLRGPDGRTKTGKKQVSPRLPIPKAKIQLLSELKKKLEDDAPQFTKHGLKNV